MRCQRWREGRDSYRPSGEVIDTSAYEVHALPDDTTAKGFVLRHHYSASYPAARWRFGLFRSGVLMGVAVFSQPMNNRVITGNLGVSKVTDGVELGRFVLLDEVPANGETWFLARCFAVLRREGLAGVVSFSDPVKRTASTGDEVFGGHLGTIYQAHNGVYLGRGTARTLALLPDGSVFSDRSASKVRKRERGWRYASQQLVAHGAPEPGEDLATWLKVAKSAVCRKLRHPGNHKYAWALSKSIRKSLRQKARSSYPKVLG